MKEVQREFDAKAPVYEANRLAPWYKAHADLILDACGPSLSGDVLDVGCGTGYLLRTWLRDHPDARGAGIDISNGMVETARRHAAREGVSNCRFIQGDWETMDISTLGGYTFRSAFCVNAFHYFSAPDRAARKLAEALPDGASLYLWERNKSNSPLTRLWAWLHRHFIKDHVEFYTAGELQRIFSEAGFREATPVLSVNRLLWKRKLYTSALLIQCRK